MTGEGDHDDLVSFLLRNKKKDLETILMRKNTDNFHVLHIHSQELLDVSTNLFSQAMSDPDKTIPKLDADLHKALDHVFEEDGNANRGLFIKKEKVHLRISHLPAIPWFQKKSVPRSMDSGDVIQLVGTITKTIQPKLLSWRQNVSCVKCGYVFPVQADYDQFYTLPHAGRLTSFFIIIYLVVIPHDLFQYYLTTPCELDNFELMCIDTLCFYRIRVC